MATSVGMASSGGNGRSSAANGGAFIDGGTSSGGEEMGNYRDRNAPIDVNQLRAYLEMLLAVVMSASHKALAKSMFARNSDQDWREILTDFASESSMTVLFINKIRSITGQNSNSVAASTSSTSLTALTSQDDDEDIYEYQLALRPSYTPSHVASIALIKRVPLLDISSNLAAQLHFVSLLGPSTASAPTTNESASSTTNEESTTTIRVSPYEALHSVVHNVMSPWFDAYVTSKESFYGNKKSLSSKDAGADAKMGIPMTKRKFAELELSLLHLQQNVEIPEIQLRIHPIVRSTIDRCTSSGTRITVDEVKPPTILQDSTFLNKLQSDVNIWVKEVQTVTKLDRDVAAGSAAQEVNFWLSMERAHEAIEDQLKSAPIVLTLDILKHAKRFHATVSFYADTGLKDCAEKIHNYNLLMKDFPLNDLLSATDLDKCADAVYAVFGHLNRKLKISPYPVKRALGLVESISRDINDTMIKILAGKRLMYQDFSLFCDTVTASNDVFHAWDEMQKDFVNTARDLTRKRMEKFLPIKINATALTKLRERLNYIGAFRKTHEQLRVMVNSGTITKSSIAGMEMAEEVSSAYEIVKSVDILDLTGDEGGEIWSAAEAAYNERVARVENSLISQLRDLLGQCKSAREMLRVLSQFNSLFVRPKVRGAVQEYQQQLLISVKSDIQALQDKFKAQYRPSEANHMSQLRDLPEIAGAIIWARQIERQLNIYMKRVEDVLGRGWELYADGQKLANEGEVFRKKLETKPLFEGWLNDIMARRDLNVSGRLFDVTHKRSSNTYQLAVNFEPQVISLFKEVRNLIWLGFQIPHTINNLAKDAKRVYPHAVSLMETVRTYNQTCEIVKSNPGGIARLLAQIHTDVQALVAQGMSLRWENFANTYESHRTAAASAYLPGSGGADAARENKQVLFVRQFASLVALFQEKTDEVVQMQREVFGWIDELHTCSYTAEAFSQLLQKIQATIDRLNLEGYPNLEEWVMEVNARIEDAFEVRLKSITSAWCDAFIGASNANTGRRQDNNTIAKDNEKQRDHVQLSPALHEIRIQNQVIYVDPPVEHARAHWFKSLYETWGTICCLRCVQSARYEIEYQMRRNTKVNEADQTYVSLLARFAIGKGNGDSDVLAKPFALIEAKITELSRYVSKWLQFQSLWDLEADHVYARLGDSLAKWQQLLSEIRKTRSTFDNSDTKRSFGIVVIDYEQVQSKVNAKYDTWQRDLLSKFGAKLGNEMRETYAALSKARTDLEHHSIEGTSTAQTVTFITFVQDLKKKVKKWQPLIELFSIGQKTLERQRYMFGQDWLYVDQVEGEWSAFNEILSRKNAGIQEQLAGLQMKIMAEDKIVAERIASLITEWEQGKPISGSLKPDAALHTIASFETRLTKLVEDRDLVIRAKESIDLASSAEDAVNGTNNDGLEPVAEELRDLKAVWTALTGTWNQLSELREMQWSNVQPRKLRQQLDGLLNATNKDMPSRMRQYAAFEHIQEIIRGFLKSNSLVGDLKSDAMRERHWRALFKQLRVSTPYTPSNMTLGIVWDLDLRKNEQPIKAIILQAQGEMALEEYLRQVRETWTNYTLDLVNYQNNKCKLIRGWDNLFQLAGDHLNALRAMSMSPHYKVFEEEASIWQERLSKISVLFDTWIDVQRQWVYLEGIFTGSAEIRHILPVESSRFSNINSEFMTVMKKVYKSPFVLDVLAIPGVQKSLERLADLLGKIQKALGEYLERERAMFPRFYFVGDEDLLEIIGNSKDIIRIMKHFKKMFAGLATVTLDDMDNPNQLLGMVSREGEEVPFRTPIVLAQHAKINEWLSKMESEMRFTLAALLTEAVSDLNAFYCDEKGLEGARFLGWIQKYPAQLVVLAIQTIWTRIAENALEQKESLEKVLQFTLRSLDVLADTVLSDIETIQRRKCEHLITELVNQRDITRSMIFEQVKDTGNFVWLSQMRFYLNNTTDPNNALRVEMANATFPYGFEYLGITDKLVTTPLTRRCYLTLTQALHYKLGGAPEGPAGTGKTETVKALGAQLGQMVLVFCCDETFDFQAMGRIFVGLCRTGGWGCFDEFNRLEERILSAVSQQIQAIQNGLASSSNGSSVEVELLGKSVEINPRTAIAVTSNPTYAGRSKLPDNLKKLFRPVVMSQPDREIIAQVLLYAQGFRTAEKLSSKIVPFFNLCAEQLSNQPHYDFGLRALKSVLVSAGQLKREHLLSGEQDSNAEDLSVSEQEILIQSVSETIVPKLVAEDVPLLSSLLSDVFPGIEYKPVNLDELKKHIEAVCKERNLVFEEGSEWLQKVLQLYQIQKISHGLMMVGPSGTGKTQAWQILLTALERLEGIEGVSYVIDPKAVPKEALYGTLDPTTREWNDGLFTHVLRKIVDNVRGESAKRHWIIFDGDVDPEWVENLNSVLDDNKLLTLPNGERLGLPPNVRIMFEVEHLRFATLATVSRCGMVWFSEETVHPKMMFENYLDTLRTLPLSGSEEEDQTVTLSRRQQASEVSGEANLALGVLTQRMVADAVAPYFIDEVAGEGQSLIEKSLQFAASKWHIMDFTAGRALSTLFSLINKTVRNIMDYDAQHPDFPLAKEIVHKYATRRLFVAIVWSFTGDSEISVRGEMGEFLRDQATDVELPSFAGGGVGSLNESESLIDFDVRVADAEWFNWTTRVPTIEVETNAVASADVVIPTTDTVRHEDVLYSWLSEHKPLMLCGPPGSGKTMTLFSALRKLPDQEVVGLNFSSATTPELILKTFEQYCEYRKTPSGVVLAPVQIGKWIVLFCDEINLPSLDKYGTQRVISFLRQLVERGGFWRTSDKSWVTLERIQFVGACNPPTDPGRVPLSQRFLRHAPLVMVGYPAAQSLMQIYGTFNRALLKVTPNLRGFADPLTAAMVDFFLETQKRFTPDKSPTYVYSPRELTRWMRGVLEILSKLDTTVTLEGLIRIWAYEALRIFSDRLIDVDERQWTDNLIANTAQKHFPTMDHGEALQQPIVFSNWLSRNTQSVDMEALRSHTSARLRQYSEEELDTKLVLFDSVLVLATAIDRVLRQRQGHLLLIGVSGSGRTTIARFVAWMNGLSVFTIATSRKYSMADFDDDLRIVLKRAGCQGEKISFIIDESQIRQPAFLERMNTLLANSEVPGLFEGDEYSALITACKEGSARDGLLLDSNDELMAWFSSEISKNLHVIFTMNPVGDGMGSRAAASPALFNRCVLLFCFGQS